MSPTPRPTADHAAAGPGSGPALSRIDKLAEDCHSGAKALATYYVCRAVELMNTKQSMRGLTYDFRRDYSEAVEQPSGTLAE